MTAGGAVFIPVTASAAGTSDESVSEQGSEEYGEYYENSDGTLSFTGMSHYEGKEFTVPAYHEGKKVTRISDEAFNYNTAIERVVLPDTVTEIGNFAFSQCTNLKSVNIPSGLKKIGSQAFCGTAVESVTIPATLEEIGYSVFNGAAIRELTLSDGLKTIGLNMFYGSKIRSVVIPDSVTEIEDGAFEWCQELESVTIGTGLTEISDFNFCKKLKSITFRGNSLVSLGGFECAEALTSLSIPDGVKELSGFTYCYSLETVRVPDSLRVVTSETFRNSPFLANAGDAVYLGKVFFKYRGTGSSCYIKDGTIHIAENAFEDNTDIQSVYIPASVTGIGEYAFWECTALKTVGGAEGLLRVGRSAFGETAWLSAQEEKGEDVYLGNVFLEKVGKKARVLIKAGTVSIADNAFLYDSDLTSVRIPTSVKVIGDGSFYGTNNLTEVTIPHKVEEICDEAFRYSGLTSVTLPDNLKKLGKYAFYCTQISEINMSGSIGTIPEGAFSNNDKLRSVTIPAGIKVIESGAFEDCIYLENVSFPNTLKEIGSYAFSTGITVGEDALMPRVTIPASVTRIEEKAIGFWPYGTTNTIIYGAKGSEAERYALENGFPFNDEYMIYNDYMLFDDYTTFPAPAKLNLKLGSGNTYYYRRQGAKNWIYLGEGNGVVLSLKNIGVYELKRIEECEGSDEAYESVGNICIVSPDKYENASTLSSEAVNAGIRVTIYGFAKGGTGKYTYTYKYKRSTAKNWTTLAEDTTATEASIAPKTAGVFDIMVTVKDQGTGLELVKEFKLPVYSAEEFENTSTVSAANVTAGTRVTMNGSAKGGTTVYEYSYCYKRSTASKWNVIGGSPDSDYTNAASASFRPSSAGTYNVRIIARDADGKEIAKDFTVTVK